MELSRRTIQRMILRKSGDTTVINQGSEGGGGGSQPSVALGPLLTSLNSEAMPSAEGYLHWTGSAWSFDTPTGGDPVDLTPYAQKTWVQDNFAYKNDLVNFITKTEADGYYAALNHTHDNYLPLSAGANKALTGSLYITGSNGIQWAGSPGVGMLCYMPSSGWTGISASQWGVGATSAQGVIRSNANDILHYRNGTNYKIWDAYNFTPSDYLPLTGGTVESLTVTNGLDADAITVGSIVNSDTLAEYLDQDASDARYLQLTGGTLTGNLRLKDASTYGMKLLFGDRNYCYLHEDYDDHLTIYADQGIDLTYGEDGDVLINGDKVATENFVTGRGYITQTTADGRYLQLATDGTVNGNLNVKGTIQAQDSNGNNKVIIYGTTGNIRAEKVYIGGSTSGYEASTHDWVTSQGYQANVIETVKVAGTALTPTSKAVDIPAATSDGSTFGVVAIGTGFTFDEDRLCVDTSTFATRTWTDGRYLPLAGGTMHGSLMMQSDLSADNFPARTGHAIGMLAQLNQHATQGDNGYRGGVFFMYAREQQGGQSIAQDKLNAVIISCLSEYKSNWYNGDFGLMITADDVKFKGASLAKASDLSGYLPLAGYTMNNGAAIRFRGSENNGVYIDKDGIAWHEGSWNASAIDIAYDSVNDVGVATFAATPKVGTSYIATQSWVDGRGFASAQDLYDLGTLVTTGYLPLTAGSSHPLTGNIAYKGTKATYDMITFIDDPSSQWGNGIAIGGGGATIIGGGESAATMIGQLPKVTVDGVEYINGGSELMYIGNDTSVSIFTNLQNGWDYRKEFTFYNTGVLSTAGSVVTPNGSGLYIEDTGGTERMAVFVNNSNQFFVGFGMRNAGYEGYFDSNVMYLRSGASGTTMTLDANNRVGIGTTSPAYKLDVNGNTGVTGSLDVSIELSVGDVTNGGVWLSDSALGVWTMSGTTRQETELMSLASGGVTFSGDTVMTGKLAVGTTTFDGSNAKLQVGGNMFATGSITSKSNAGNVSLGNGNISATNLYISTVVFGNSNNDAAIYVSNGHVWARNSSGTSTMIV